MYMYIYIIIIIIIIDIKRKRIQVSQSTAEVKQVLHKAVIESHSSHVLLIELAKYPDGHTVLQLWL